MAYNEKHLAKLADLKALGTKQKEVADALAARVDTLENVGSQANVLEGVKVNGTALAIANKMVDILIALCPKIIKPIDSIILIDFLHDFVHPLFLFFATCTNKGHIASKSRIFGIQAIRYLHSGLLLKQSSAILAMTWLMNL